MKYMYLLIWADDLILQRLCRAALVVEKMLDHKATVCEACSVLVGCKLALESDSNQAQKEHTTEI